MKKLALSNALLTRAMAKSLSESNEAKIEADRAIKLLLHPKITRTREHFLANFAQMKLIHAEGRTKLVDMIRKHQESLKPKTTVKK